MIKKTKLANLKSNNSKKIFDALVYFDKLMGRQYLSDIIELYYNTSDIAIKIEAFKVIIHLGAMRKITENDLYVEYIKDKVDTTIFNIIENAIQNSNQNLKFLALVEIRSLQLKRFRKEILQMLDDQDKDIRTEAIYTYSTIGTKDDFDIFLNIIRTDSVDEVIYNTLDAIESLGDLKTAEKLNQEIDTFPKKYRKNIISTIKKLSTTK